MNKFTLIISSLFNKPSRLAILDYNGNPKPNQFEDGPLDCQSIDICMEGHLQVSDLANTKTLGSLFQTNLISWKDIKALSVQVASQYSRPTDPLLTSSVRPSPSGERTLTVSDDTLFNLMQPDKPIRLAQSKSDKRDISFFSLRVVQPREVASLVFD